MGRRDRRAARAARVAGVVALAGAAVVGSAGSSPAGAEPVPHAQYLNLQWGLSAIGAPSAWPYATGAGVRIGIVDTGVDFAQQDLQGKVVAGQAYVSAPSNGCASPTSAQDDNGHGTHVAGIAAASGAHGVEGVAPGASLVVAKVLDCQGTGSYQDVAKGIEWVVQQGAKVVNLSLGDAGTGLIDQSQFGGSPLASALTYAWDHGAVPVVAAGNNSNGLLGLGESNYTNVPAVVVAATGPSGALASYSNSIDQAEWGIAAPGGDDTQNGPTTPTCGKYDPSEILSTFWTAANPTSCYASDEGTSMATPFVTGTLALLLGRGLTPSEAVQTLLATANHGVACGTRCAGLVNADAAVLATVNRTPAAPAPSTGTPASSVVPRPSSAPGSGTAPAGQPVTAPASSPSTSSPTTSTSTSSPEADDRRATAAATGRHGGGGSSWWIVLPVLGGLALLSLAGIGGRRALVLRRAVVQPPSSEPYQG